MGSPWRSVLQYMITVPASLSQLSLVIQNQKWGKTSWSCSHDYHLHQPLPWLYSHAAAAAAAAFNRSTNCVLQKRSEREAAVAKRGKRQERLLWLRERTGQLPGFKQPSRRRVTLPGRTSVYISPTGSDKKFLSPTLPLLLLYWFTSSFTSGERLSMTIIILFPC